MKLQRAFFLVVALVFLVSLTSALSGGNNSSGLAQVGASSGQAVSKFVLVNADSDADIVELTNGYTIDQGALGTSNFNVRAETTPAVVGSVRMVLDQMPPVIENNPPYALARDNGAGDYNAMQFIAGNHTLSAAPATQSRFRGTIGTAKVVNFSVVTSGGANTSHTGGSSTTQTAQTTTQNTTTINHSGPMTASFTLVNADTNQDIMDIADGAVISLSDTGTTNLTVRANTDPVISGSVKFGLNGNQNYLIENLWPYTIRPGINNDDYTPWSYQLGTNYTLTATPYSESRARGTAGTPATIHFTIVAGNSSSNNSHSSEPQGDLLPSGNGVHVASPGAGIVVAVGQTLPMTCDITTEIGFTVYKLVFAWYQVTSSGTNAGNFAVHDNVSYTTGSYTQNATIPANAQSGAFSFQCVAYFTGHNTYESAQDTANVTIASAPVPVSNLKVFLGGPYNSATGKMSTGLNDANVIPLTEPYTSMGYSFTQGAGSTISSSVLSPVGDNAIVDWVIVELRSSTNNLNVVYSRPALVQADGDVVTTNGTTSILGSLPSGNYYVVIHHRNHLAIMTANPVSTTQNIDMTTLALYGNEPAKIVNGVKMLWPGDVNNDGMVRYTGTSNDKDIVFQVIGGLVPTNTVSNTYSGSDVNMDGIVKYTGSNNDRDIILQSTFATAPNYLIYEQLPQVASVAISSMEVVSSSGASLVTLTPGMQINMGTQSSGFGPNISIKANPASGSPTPGSVKFILQGVNPTYSLTENSAPYSLFGDSGSTYNPWPNIAPGPYTVIATPYTGANATGTAGTPLSIAFVIVNNDDTTPPTAPTNVSLGYKSSSTIQLSWTPSTDNIGVVAYQIFRNGSPLGAETTSSQNISRPAGNAGDSILVKARDAANNWSAASIAVSEPALSSQFTNGQAVQTNASATVYNTLPSYTSTGTQSSGATGTIVGSAVYWNGGNYWNVNFATGTDGWVDQTKLVVVGGGSNVPTVFVPKRALSPNEIAIVINSDNPISSSIGNYYKNARAIPTANVITVALGNSTFVTASSFNTVRSSILSQLPAGVQAIAFAGEKPFVVRNNTSDSCTNSSHTCMSLTSALAMGYSTSNTGSGTITSTSYYNSDTLTPRTTYGYIPTMMLAGRTAAEGQTFINQGVNSDNTYPNPAGSVYAIQTTDHARSLARQSDMANVVPTMFISGNQPVSVFVNNYCAYTGCGDYQYGGYTGNYITGQTVIGYHTGADWVPSIGTNTIKLGALAEHVTSFGGFLQDSSTSNDGSTYRKNDYDQMPITQWLEYGFSASVGTVQEPWCCDSTGGLQSKFPLVSKLWENYYTGASALESYGKSIQRPGQTLFVGEPLANPWKTPQVTFSGTTLTIKTTQIKPGETNKLQESTDGTTWTDVSGFTNIQSPSGKLGLQTVSYVGANANKCYRLIKSAPSPATTSFVQIPVTAGTVWTATNGITNTGSCSLPQPPQQPDTQAPTVPGGLTSTSTTTSSISLDWTDSTDNVAVTGYKIWRSSTSTGTYSQVGTSVSSDYVDTGLVSGTTYFYKVSAYDAAGNNSTQAPSNGFSATTQTPVPSNQISGINGPVGPDNNEDISPTDTSSDYYIACQSGNDNNNGLTATTPWKTLTKLNQNTSSMTAGWKVYFKRGETCYGTINAYKSGTSSSPIQYLAYGSGPAPIISGANPVTTTWTTYSGNIWKANVGTGLNPKYLFIGDSIQTLARHPNTGWLFTDSMTTTAITDSPLGTAPLSSLAGANVVLRDSPWSYRKLTVSGQSGSTINFGATGFQTWWEDTGWGYMLDNKLAFLDTPGEWFYNSTTGDLYLWAPGNENPNTMTVSLSARDVGFSPGYGRTDVKVKNLVFEGYQSNSSDNNGVFFGGTDGNMKRVTVENVEIRNSDRAIRMYTENNSSSDADIIRNNYIHDIYNEAFWLLGSSGHLIEGNIFENIGINPQLGANASGWNLFGLRTVGSGTNYTIRRNIIKKTGYIGAVLGGSGTFTENYIENPDYILNDGGGIAFDYTNGLTISKNIIKDVSSDMTSMPLLYAGYSVIGNGIYFGDKDIKNTSVSQNVIMNTPSSGVWMDHSAGYVGNSITNNVIYGAGQSGLGASDYSNYQAFPSGCGSASNSVCFVSSFNDVVTGNKVYGLNANQTPLSQLYVYSNGSGAVVNFGVYNNNYYYNPFTTTKVKTKRNFSGVSNNYTFAQWQALVPPHDALSTTSSYTLTNPNQAAQIYYNATLSPTTQSVNGCNANGTALTGTQTIQPFSSLVVEFGNC